MTARTSADAASADTTSAARAFAGRALTKFLPTIFLPTIFLQTICLPTVSAVEVDPLRLELIGSPGQTLTGSLYVINHREEPVRVIVQTGAYRYTSASGAKRLPSCQPWITILGPEASLNAVESLEIGYAIQIPSSAGEAGAGEYLAAILVDELGEAATGAGGPGAGTIAIRPRIAIPVYVILEGRQTPAGRIVDLVAQPGPQPGITRVRLTVMNEGQAHFRPTGTMLITDAAQQVVHRGSLGRAAPVFPGTQATIPMWVQLPAGRYTAVATVDIGSEQLLQRELSFSVTDDASKSVDR